MADFAETVDMADTLNFVDNNFHSNVRVTITMQYSVVGGLMCVCMYVLLVRKQ